jgi:hypothetical protein
MPRKRLPRLIKTTHQKAEGTMEDQQVAQLLDRYMMIMNNKSDISTETSYLGNGSES